MLPGVWDLSSGFGPNSLGVPENGWYGINGVLEYITTQANGYTSKNSHTTGAMGPCSPAEYTIIPATVNFLCSPSPTACSLAPNGCQYNTPPVFTLQGFALPNGPFYTNWDDFLADLIADGCVGVLLQVLIVI